MHRHTWMALLCSNLQGQLGISLSCMWPSCCLCNAHLLTIGVGLRAALRLEGVPKSGFHFCPLVDIIDHSDEEGI